MSAEPIQVCFYDGYSWNISAAEALVAGRDPQQVDIRQWVTQLSSANINESHWPTADLTKPLIIAPLPRTGELRPIDGWHRIRRAAAEGVTTLPAHVLTRTDEQRIRGHEPES